ncbi:thiosulfate oxidation carrier protein SoxY [Pseudothauera rhizosphaerae]|nr:thiosulfate oxidation carrier protein SoxY [Pseudothauera rhizosphaerae]
MHPQRRRFLHATGASAALGVLLAAGVLRPAHALAAGSERIAFQARTLAAALQALGNPQPPTSADIVIDVPDVAENGAAVPLAITSRLPGTRRISVLVDDNPQPLALQFEFAAEVQPRFQARIKMGQSSQVRVLAEADGGAWIAARPVQVTIGGCGA